MKHDLDQLPRAQRRLLLVANDETYDRIASQFDWRRLARALFKVGPLDLIGARAGSFVHDGRQAAAAAIGPHIASSAYLTPTWSFAAKHAVVLRRTLPFRGTFGARTEVPIPHATREEVIDRYRFDHEHPEDGSVYVLHPFGVPDAYVQPALLNERLAIEKLPVLLELAAALGAREVTVTSGRLAERRNAPAGPSLPELAAYLGLNVTFAEDVVQRTVIAQFERPWREPFIPEGLRPWLDDDPVLTGFAKTRLQQSSVLELALEVTFGETVDVRAKACAELEAKGMDAGGRFRRVVPTRWSFQFSFFPHD